MKGWLTILLCVAFGALIGAAITYRWQHAIVPTAGATPQAARPTLESLSAEVERLKTLVPSQSHAMADVQFHWTNLWFAARQNNWPLAQFYFDESRQHVLWMIRIRPIRKGPDGGNVDLKGIFDAVDTSSLAAVKQAIEAKDSAQFSATYKTMLESCYACHKASGKPYLRPMIPREPEQSMINFDPKATWPQ
jgi:cytochrome c553